MHLRRISRPAVLLCASTLAVVLGAGPALAGDDEPPEDGLIVADDLPGDWEEGPPDEEDEDELDETAEEIDACEDIIEITDELDEVEHVEGSEFTLDDQEIKSGAGVLSRRLARRAVRTYASGDAAECFEELLAANPIFADFEIETESGEGPDIGDGSAELAAELSGEDPTTGEEAALSLRLVVVRVGNAIAIYEYQSEDDPANEEEFTDAVEAAGERLAEAV